MEYINRTLIVEDNKQLRKLLSLYFNRNNLFYDLAEDGKIALKKIDEESKRGFSYRTILTDLNMPNLDGVQLIELIGEKVGRGEIFRPEIYVITGGHQEIDKVNKSSHVRRVFEKTSFYEAIEEIKRFYSNLRY